MLRITEVQFGNGHIVLRLEGRVVGPWVDELKIACERLMPRERAIKLDLAEVIYVDRKGLELLRKLQSQDVCLERCSPFVAQELKDIR
jgi:ABC-type transporter Mla MlaB component